MPENENLIPETHTVEGENQSQVALALHIYTMVLPPPKKIKPHKRNFKKYTKSLTTGY